MRTVITAVVVVVALASALGAQQPQKAPKPRAATPAQPAPKVASIDPGMTRAQVIERLGPPLSSRSFESFTYLLYRNGCEKKCGMNDLVVLDSGKVVDAVFRSAERAYTGASSSPKMIDADAAKRPDAKPPAPLKKPA